MGMTVARMLRAAVVVANAASTEMAAKTAVNVVTKVTAARVVTANAVAVVIQRRLPAQTVVNVVKKVTAARVVTANVVAVVMIKKKLRDAAAVANVVEVVPANVMSLNAATAVTT